MMYVQSRARAEADKAKQISLQIAVVLDSRPTEIAFTLKNQSDRDIVAVPPGEDYSRIVIVKPDGEALEVFILVFRTGPLPTVSPSESKTWRVEISPMLELYDLETPGAYRVHWVLKDRKLEHEFRSNELVLLKEADGAKE